MKPAQVIQFHPRAAPYAQAIVAACARYEVDTPVRQAILLANLAHESGLFRYTKELWGPTTLQSGYKNRVDLGNTDPRAINYATLAHDPDVGHFYAGHGLIQVTGFYNHLKCSQFLYGDDRGARNPSLFTSSPGAVDSAFWYWSTHQLNELCDAGDDAAFVAVVRKINPGLLGLDERRALWHQAKAILYADEVES